MKRLGLILSGAAVAGAAALAAGATQSESAAEGVTFMGEPVTADNITLGQEIYAANCASCHGADLEGQPDWKRRLDNGRMPAPPHDKTGHTWHHPDNQLFTITKLGVGAVVEGYESDMPAFEGILTDAEIRSVLGYIKSTWPQRERGFQADVTGKEKAAP
ncbi:cytochrome c [Paracoccus sp. PAMC 22219]|uniref:c-type cytochrome n=1 Tax=Paracoccus sp. PAMC 22219 TaxID=1569209 RepID=UPI0005A9F7D9|nr:cytochrome c [Paracoccus sp. PAMC 22219]